MRLVDQRSFSARIESVVIMKHFGFVMEQTLGHVTHHQNLARWVTESDDIRPTWLPITPEGADRWERLPGVRSNWSLKGSLRARDALRGTKEPFDALFLHTQTVALFSVGIMRRVPSVVSLDATPLNYDTVGAQYGHVTGNNRWLERRKYLWNQKTFQEATALVTWCEWAKESLVNDYGISAEKVTVIPPGVDMANWNFGAERGERAEGKTRLLFVGGDFERKGGRFLLEAFRSQLQGVCTLDIVTKEAGVEAQAEGLEGVRIHRGLTANSPGLKELYATADLFVFPTLADCLPIAVMEAMAAGLPVIATRVGALSEEVENGVNGLIVPPSDAGAVVSAVCSLAHDPARRGAMGSASRQLAEERFDARRNYNAILDLMRRIAHNKVSTKQ